MDTVGKKDGQRGLERAGKGVLATGLVRTENEQTLRENGRNIGMATGKKDTKKRTFNRRENNK